jgi:hypothetical protein
MPLCRIFRVILYLRIRFSGLDNDTVRSTERKNASHKDLSYRPSNHVKSKTKKIDSIDGANQLENGRNHVDMVTEQLPPTLDDASHGILPRGLIEGSHGEDGKVEPYSVAHTDQNDITEEKEAILQPTATSGFDGADEERHSASLEYAGKAVLMKPASPNTSAPAMPGRQITDVLPSPQTEEIHRGKIQGRLRVSPRHLVLP